MEIQSAQALAIQALELFLKLPNNSVNEALQSLDRGGYQKIKIPKKTGGVRILFSPSEELRLVQEELKKYFYQWSVDDHLYAYVPERSTVDGVRCHIRGLGIRKSAPFCTLRLDLKDAFGHVTDDLLYQMFQKIIKADLFATLTEIAEIKNETTVQAVGEEFIQLIIRITTIEKVIKRRDDSFVIRVLPQGTATSPYLYNLALCWAGVVEDLMRVCRKYKMRLSIYADDITLSTHEKMIIKDIQAECIKAVENSGWFKVNPDKTQMNCRRHRAHLITGVRIICDRWGSCCHLSLPQ